jgi:hypothetical protein
MDPFYAVWELTTEYKVTELELQLSRVYSMSIRDAVLLEICSSDIHHLAWFLN